MAVSVHCDIVSAEQGFFSGLVELVVVNGKMGELGIAPAHTPLLTEINPGPVRLTLQGGHEQVFYISGGFLDVQPGHISILADTVVRGEDISEAEALKAKKEAERMLHDSNSNLKYAQAQSKLVQAVAQLRTISAIKKRLSK